MSGRTLRALQSAAALLFLVGAGLRIAPASPRVHAVAGSETPAPAPARPDAASPRPVRPVAAIVAGNPFASDRTPPAQRWVPPEIAARSAPSGPPVSVKPPPRAPRLRLYGVVIGPDGGLALIDGDPAVPGAELYRVGDRVGGARLITIGLESVILEGRDGRFTLTLPRSPGRSR